MSVISSIIATEKKKIITSALAEGAERPGGFVVPPLFYFAKHELGYSLLNEINKEWCNDLESWLTQDDLRLLVLEPRSTYKSTIFVDSFPLWWLLKNNNDCIALTSKVEDQVTRHMLTLQNLLTNKKYFIDNNIKLAGNYSSYRINLNLRTDYGRSEPNIMARSAYSSWAGLHFNIIIIDDLVNEKDKDSTAELKRSNRWIETLEPLLIPGNEKCKIIMLGTRYRFGDAYEIIKSKTGWTVQEGSVYIDKERKYTRFPHLTHDKLNRMKNEMGSKYFSAQMENNPLPDDTQIFPPSIISFYKRNKVDKDHLIFYGFLDPSLGKTRDSDYTAIVTVAYDNEKYYIWDVFLQRCTKMTTIKKVAELHKRYNYKYFGFESNNFQILLEDDFKNEFRKENINFYKLIDVTHSKSKDSRIEGLQGKFESGKILFPDDYDLNEELFEAYTQLLQHPGGLHDDFPDALEGAIALALEYRSVTGVTL